MNDAENRRQLVQWIRSLVDDHQPQTVFEDFVNRFIFSAAADMLAADTGVAERAVAAETERDRADGVLARIWNKLGGSGEPSDRFGIAVLADEVVAAHAEAVAVVAMLYDKWEQGDDCYEEPDTRTNFLGKAFRLSDREEERILAIVPKERSGLALEPPEVAELREENMALREALAAFQSGARDSGPAWRSAPAAGMPTLIEADAAVPEPPPPDTIGRRLCELFGLNPHAVVGIKIDATPGRATVEISIGPAWSPADEAAVAKILPLATAVTVTREFWP